MSCKDKNWKKNKPKYINGILTLHKFGTGEAIMFKKRVFVQKMKKKKYDMKAGKYFDVTEGISIDCPSDEYSTTEDGKPGILIEKKKKKKRRKKSCYDIELKEIVERERIVSKMDILVHIRITTVKKVRLRW